MKLYSFYLKNDINKESINSSIFISRKAAAIWFSTIKMLSLKEFLKIYSISR